MPGIRAGAVTIMESNLFEPQDTLFARIGGQAAVAEMIDAFYIRVLADPELRPTFEGASLERLHNMQKEFFATALDGPVSRSDHDLVRAHAGLQITRHQLTLFVRHLIGVLDSRELISRSDAMEIVFRIASYTDDIVGDSED